MTNLTNTAELRTYLQQGWVIPAHPLALNAQRQLDVRRQRALTRYYLDAGAGGLAVGVHSTQFEIRDPNIDLFKPVLQLAAETIDAHAARTQRSPVCKIAGVCGDTPQALAEAELARELGYHACLLSLAALSHADIDTLINPDLGHFLEVKSRTWSRDDAIRKSQIIAELIEYLGASSEKAETQDYTEIVENHLHQR